MEPIKTVGRILTGEETRRDAIHIAIAPVLAGETLKPGERVAVRDGYALRPGPGLDAIGIVDPFLDVDQVMGGEQFWLWLTPNTITSLCHVWSHPAFDMPPALRKHLEKKDHAS